MNQKSEQNMEQPMKKVAVFSDVGNLYYCIGKKFEARKLDYRRYMEYVKTFGEVYQAYAYGSQVKDEAKNFVLCLKQIGFMTKFKEHDREEKRRVNWGAGIAIDVVNVVERVDTVIIGSSDPDLLPVVEYIKSKGVSVIIIAAGIHRDLKKACNSFVEISEDMLEEAKKAEPEVAK
jgi:uncharacterized LabA/DUF88 family protein